VLPPVAHILPALNIFPRNTLKSPISRLPTIQVVESDGHCLQIIEEGIQAGPILLLLQILPNLEVKGKVSNSFNLILETVESDVIRDRYVCEPATLRAFSDSSNQNLPFKTPLQNGRYPLLCSRRCICHCTGAIESVSFLHTLVTSSSFEGV
jgi:hypothetical protein